MTIEEKALKLLWGRSGGICAFTGCQQALTMVVESETPVVIGENAHICGKRNGSARHNPNLEINKIDSYENLILLCPTHHTLIDKTENIKAFDVQTLLEIKKTHEEKIAKRLIDVGNNLNEEINKIRILLTENYSAFSEFGPNSIKSQKHSNNEKLHLKWLEIRVTKLVPNNILIKSILEAHIDEFSKQISVSSIHDFILHADSYREWVEGNIGYELVKRFPVLFFEEIERIFRVSIQ